jgi:hypothetical protein
MLKSKPLLIKVMKEFLNKPRTIRQKHTVSFFAILKM